MTIRRSYGQFCALARALDRIGDRWTLLIVRELLLGPQTYRDLASALDGISPNILVERLRVLVDDGLVRRNDAPARSRSVRYELTELGAGLEPIVFDLIRWATPWMAPGPGDDRVDPRWTVLALRALLDGTQTRTSRAGIVHLFVERQPVSIEIRDGVRHVRLGAQGVATASCSMSMPAVLAVASGVRRLSELDIPVDGDRRFAVAALSGDSGTGARVSPRRSRPAG